MKTFHRNSFAILIIFSMNFLSNIHCFPCPNECLCKTTSIDESFKEISYTIDCTNGDLRENKLVYQAPVWSLDKDRINDDLDDNSKNEYMISLIFSNSTSLKTFNKQTVQLSGFSYTIQSLSLTQQSTDFLLQSDSFNSDLYQNLKFLNLSSCCQQIPSQCSKLFQPLIKLEILDLSGSNFYTACLNTPDPISTQLRDLILRHNQYQPTAFSHSSQLFTGVRHITGKLDLQNSFFNFTIDSNGNCLFDQFTLITSLDLSSIQFPQQSNSIDIYLKHLLYCKVRSNQIRNGEQLIELYLRQLNLQNLPQWFTNDRFPLLKYLDLSKNQFYSIDIQSFSTLKSLSLAYNPIAFENITWRLNDTSYDSINLRSTRTNQLFNFTDQLENLLKLSSNIDFSENPSQLSNYLSNFAYNNDFDSQIILNLSRTNLNLFDIDEISNFDELYSLDISWNYLRELNLEKQSKLAYLDCSNQKIEKLLLSSESSNLIEMKCSNNSLKTIENFALTKHKYIQLIDLSSNSIDRLEDLFSTLTNRYLHTINLKLNSIKQILTNQFNEQLVSLYSLDLSYNQINLIQKSSFQSPNLQILDLTGNPLKNVEFKFLLISSLRLFYLINNTQQLITRCTQSKSSDSLLQTYLTWFEQNSTYMKMIAKDKSDEIQFDKCLRQYTSRSKTKWMKFNEKLHIKYISLYIIMSALGIGLVLSMIYLYKKNQWNLWRHFQRYRPLDRNHLIENAEELSQHPIEDDEIVMNLSDRPFNMTNQL